MRHLLGPAAVDHLHERAGDRRDVQRAQQPQREPEPPVSTTLIGSSVSLFRIQPRSSQACDVDVWLSRRFSHKMRSNPFFSKRLATESNVVLVKCVMRYTNLGPYTRGLTRRSRECLLFLLGICKSNLALARHPLAVPTVASSKLITFRLNLFVS